MDAESATDRVRAALAAGQAPARKDVEHSLREMWGARTRQARRFAAEGIKGLQDDGAVELLERLERLEKILRP